MIGVFTDAFIEDLQLSRAAVSSIWTATLISSSLYVNVVGRAADRWGAATVVRAAVLPYALALLLLSRACGPISLSAGYLLVRMLGPETIDFGCRLTVNMWWSRRRGFAAGVINAIGSLMVTLPSGISALKAWLGWRQTLISMSVVMGSSAALAAALLLNTPEQHGLKPDAEESGLTSAVELEKESVEALETETDAEKGSLAGRQGEGGRDEGGTDKGGKLASKVDDEGVAPAASEAAATKAALLGSAAEEERDISCADAARTLDFWMLHLYLLTVQVRLCSFAG